MARLDIIEQEEIVDFIDDALHEKLAIREKEREERILERKHEVSEKEAKA